jgi:photosynthetic reaction center cytochrome c subunit
MGIRIRFVIVALVLLTIAIILRFETPPIETVQWGYRGTGMVQVFNPRRLAAEVALNRAPPPLGPAQPAGAKASSVYKNVKVLGDISVAEFTRLMASITNWVAPGQGCNYCHVPDDLASDAKYTKVVARRMLQMVRHINTDWQSHVAQTGVTCFTCHRGQPVPAQVWFTVPAPPHAPGLVESDVGKNRPAAAAGLSALPYDPLTPFLDDGDEIRVESSTALPVADRHSIKQTEWTYSLMMNISQSLGVNCTFCHNTRSFRDWNQSTAQRVNAWHGIRMVRDLNTNYLIPLKDVFPAARLGPLGDPPKLDCATCHQGVYKPLFGVAMVKDYPELAAQSAPVK